MRRVRLVVIGVMVLFRRYSIVLAGVCWRCLRALLYVVGLVVAIGVVYVLNRVLLLKSAAE